ncbi:phage integrase N-terminal SAM-like domain-containing protein [Halomonas mongoliensis]|uniref:phage integrase N-terminal SAM-like domain-containing protein n=1 Tax=Halomonas mongoliensis TaxID=321265 RepID=UPI00403AF413
METQRRPPKLMDRVRATLRVKRYSPRTQKTYCYWIRYFIRFYRVRNPASIGAFEVKSPDKSGSYIRRCDISKEYRHATALPGKP